jgi:hypothetical protein
LPSWFSLVCKALQPEGEVFFVADAAQDLYERAPKWTDGVMKGVGFRGNWGRLNENHRLPDQASRLARQFAVKHLRPESDLLPVVDQLAIDVDPCTLRWVQSRPGKVADACLAEIDRLMDRSRNGGGPEVASWADLFLVFDDQDTGVAVVELLGKRDISVHHTFGTKKRRSRLKKFHFYKGDARPKATTIHSFKGWEARQIVVVVSSSGLAARKRLYAGITRLKRSDRGSYLTIVCADPSLRETGKEWPEFDDLVRAIDEHR